MSPDSLHFYAFLIIVIGHYSRVQAEKMGLKPLKGEVEDSKGFTLLSGAKGCMELAQADMWRKEEPLRSCNLKKSELHFFILFVS